MHAPRVALRHLSKTFPGTRALIDVGLEVEAGSIHGLLGLNGSGKSTLIKVLAGYHAPDPGAELEVDGVRVDLPLGPADPAKLGFSFVHQDLGLVDSMSVLENARIGYFQTGHLGRIHWRAERRRVGELLERFGAPLPVDARVGTLSQAERAIVAIIRALQGRDGERQQLLVLDEPTAYLPPPEIARLFEAVRRLRDAGTAVLFTTHRLDEVVELADRASVLRDQRLVATVDMSETTEEQLVERVLGERLGRVYPDAPAPPKRQVVMTVSRLAGHTARDVSFDLHRGEVLGLTGLVGMGQDELPYMVSGAQAVAAGTVEVDGRPCRLAPTELLARGVAFLPADRRRAGGIQAASLRENLTMPDLGSYFSGMRLDKARERETTLKLLSKFEVNPGWDPELPLAKLSGGNQQKALLAKWLQLPQLRVLMLHEPTQGVDIGSRRVIFELLRRAADAGTGIVLASADYQDLAQLCNRVLVLRYGRIVAELQGTELTEDRIVELCYRTDG